MRPGSTAASDYLLVRSGVPIHASVILEPADRSQYQGLRLIALVYLSIGLYVLFRRWTAPRATHFYVFCLASFVLYSFNYTGKFNTFDWTIYWGKIVAQALQPALFLHFALAFPEERPASRRHWINSLIYLPGVALIGLQVMAQWRWEATELLNTAWTSSPWATWRSTTCWPRWCSSGTTCASRTRCAASS